MPPATTICPSIDQFPGIDQYDADAPVAETSEELAGENWINAAARATVLSGASVLVLSPPAAALALALTVEPVADGPTTYVWTYTGTFQEQEWLLELTARITTSGYEYELTATSDVAELPLEDALWFNGTASFDLTEGVWNVYDPLDVAARQTYAVEWLLTGTSVALDLEVVDTENPYLGTTLTWSANEVDCLMAYSLVEETLYVGDGVLAWETDTGAGYIQASDYKEGVKGCWDENRQDLACEDVAF